MLKIEQANIRDADELAQLSKQAFDDDIHYGAPRPGGPPGYDDPVWQRRMMKLGEYYKVLQDGQMIGGVVVSRKKVLEYEVTRVFIAPEHQNQGLGEQVFEFLWETYPLTKRWTLGTPKWNARNQHFYKKVGFEKIGVDRWGGILFECIGSV
jgi:ribosomal protein S18 acetylase RimI-like enzyme